MTEHDQGKPAGRGGAGRGQGRKAASAAGDVERRTVTLDAVTVATLSELGAGNLSAGIRIAAQRLRETLP